MDPETIQESQNLSMNLATKNSIRNLLNEKLAKLPAGYEELMCDIVNLCVQMYETDMFLEPTEKYMLVKVSHFDI